MCGTPVHGQPVNSKILLIGQAPGVHEAPRGRPFAHTAGKVLFRWFQEASGMSEAELRERIYFAAVTRCFPGKNPKGQGDREPSKFEIRNCRGYLEREVELLRPRLVIPVGKLAVREVMNLAPSVSLEDVIGKRFFQSYHGWPTVIIPLPHPSGISRWPKTSPGKELLAAALAL